MSRCGRIGIRRSRPSGQTEMGGTRPRPKLQEPTNGLPNLFSRMMPLSVLTANGQPVEAHLPCTLEEFLVGQKLLPRSVVIEHNGEAVAPSEFSGRQVNAGDRLEIVKVVAGG